MLLKRMLSWCNMILVVIGGVMLAVGAGLVYIPAGVITAGLLLIVAAYVRRALEVLSADS